MDAHGKAIFKVIYCLQYYSQNYYYCRAKVEYLSRECENKIKN